MHAPIVCAYKSCEHLFVTTFADNITLQLEENKFSDYLTLMRERDARYTLFFENLGLHMKLRELDGTNHWVDDTYGDPVVLRIALDRCR